MMGLPRVKGEFLVGVLSLLTKCFKRPNEDANLMSLMSRKLESAWKKTLHHSNRTETRDSDQSRDGIEKGDYKSFNDKEKIIYRKLIQLKMKLQKLFSVTT